MAANGTVSRANNANQRIILSTVIKAQQVDEWYFASYMIPHEPIRHWMDLLDQYVAKNDAFDAVAYPWKMENFFAFYRDYFYEVVHHHHDVEEQIVVPWGEKKGVPSPPKLMGDHESLMKALNDIKAKENEWKQLAAKPAGADKDQQIKAFTLSLRSQVGE
mmetsp:Transcript_33779/g.78817  ORF Transcript_33779/g.78817 Transcript_33779/m.78817 type:complete len:161 (-) Transcript_33779:993-1475(-)